MSQALYPPASPQSIGQVLDTAFHFFKVSLVKCLPYGMLSMLAVQLPNIYYLALGRPMEPFGGGDPMWVALYLIGTVISFMMVSAVFVRQWHLLTHRPTSVRVEMRSVLRRLPAVIVMVILMTLLCAGGLILFILPGLYFLTALAFAWPALLLGSRGPVSAIRYSLHLVKGNWWRTTAVLTVALTIAIVAYIVVFALMGIVMVLAGANDVAMFTAAWAVVLIALGAVGLPVYTAMVLALYGDLILRREGADLANRLAVAPQASQ